MLINAPGRLLYITTIAAFAAAKQVRLEQAIAGKGE